MGWRGIDTGEIVVDARQSARWMKMDRSMLSRRLIR